MQMTYEQAMRPGALMLFAARKGSGYMMRSEKRGGGPSGSGRKPPRRKKAGFFYIFITLLLSVILWPIGMVMLWQRKVRMTAGTKLLVSLLTLCLSVFLIVFALTVPLDNVEFTAFQDRANDWLDKAAADVAVAGDAAMKKTSETWQVMRDFAEAGTAYTGARAADALDEGVKVAGQARTAIEGLFQRSEPEPIELPAETEAPEDTGAPDVTDEPETSKAPAETEAPKATEAPAETGEPEADEAPAGTGAPKANAAAAIADTEAPAASAAPVTDAPANTEAPDVTDAPVLLVPEGTQKPTEAPTANDADAIRLPSASPEAGDAQPLGEGTLHANGEFEPGVVDAATDAPTPAATAAPLAEATAVPLNAATALPTEAPAADAATPEPEVEKQEEPVVTEAPDAEPSEAPAGAPAEPSDGYTVKPAGEATVYFFDNGSVGFHNGPNRHDMSGAPAHTLQEAFDMGKNPCKSCGMPDKSILDEAHIAWVDADNRIHTTDECADFKGQWRLMALDSAINAGYEPCETCGADFYVEEIFPAPTPTPEPEAVTPSTALKPAGEAVVYYYDSSKGYHLGPDCSGMRNAPAHTLQEAVDSGKNACRYCKPPAASLLGLPALWLDENGVVHTSDECAAFAGQFSLVPRDDALAQALTPCPDCGAEEYLIPGTVLAEQ